jgi:hypothetical protein
MGLDIDLRWILFPGDTLQIGNARAVAIAADSTV